MTGKIRLSGQCKAWPIWSMLKLLITKQYVCINNHLEVLIFFSFFMVTAVILHLSVCVESYTSVQRREREALEKFYIWYYMSINSGLEESGSQIIAMRISSGFNLLIVLHTVLCSRLPEFFFFFENFVLGSQMIGNVAFSPYPSLCR